MLLRIKNRDLLPHNSQHSTLHHHVSHWPSPIESMSLIKVKHKIRIHFHPRAFPWTTETSLYSTLARELSTDTRVTRYILCFTQSLPYFRSLHSGSCVLLSVASSFSFYPGVFGNGASYPRSFTLQEFFLQKPKMLKGIFSSYNFQALFTRYWLGISGYIVW